MTKEHRMVIACASCCLIVLNLPILTNSKKHQSHDVIVTMIFLAALSKLNDCGVSPGYVDSSSPENAQQGNSKNAARR